MAKTRSLPDKFYDKDYEHNGIHRVPLWRIAGYALNNTATNVYLMMMNYATYYLMGWVGVGMMVASSLTMMMRIWEVSLTRSSASWSIRPTASSARTARSS